MAKRMHVYLKPKRISYKVTHPLYGSSREFDSWMELSEVTVELAELEARRLLNEEFEALVHKIADEMIDTAEEYEPEG